MYTLILYGLVMPPVNIRNWAVTWSGIIIIGIITTITIIVIVVIIIIIAIIITITIIIALSILRVWLEWNINQIK